MNYTREQFLADVTAEATALKEHATKEELNYLDIELLEPNDDRFCIYGQMTGSCFSVRAYDLMANCCKRYFKNSQKIYYSLQEVQETVNGETCDIRNRGVVPMHFSSVETYIFTEGSKNANLIAFLRDERKDLVL